MKTGVSKESTLRKYRITDRFYNRVIDSEPEVSKKVKKCEFKKKKSSKTSTNIYLHVSVITWFKDARDRGDQIQADQSRKRSKQNLCNSNTPSP